MGEIRSYRDLRVWQAGMDLTEQCYRVTRTFPKEELYGLINQLRRAAVSVPSNIAEGYGRESKGEYIQFLRIAQGSLKELETHLLLAVRVELTTESTIQSLLLQSDSLGKQLHTLIRSLQK